MREISNHKKKHEQYSPQDYTEINDVDRKNIREYGGLRIVFDIEFLKLDKDILSSSQYCLVYCFHFSAPGI